MVGTRTLQPLSPLGWLPAFVAGEERWFLVVLGETMGQAAVGRPGARLNG